MTDGEGSPEWLGQAFALLLVAGLIGLVVWFAQGYEPDPAVGFVDDAAAEASDAAVVDAEPDGLVTVVEEEVLEVSRLHGALFGAVVEESEGLSLEERQGCVLHVALGPGPAIGQVRLHCGEYFYESQVFAEPVGTVEEGVTPDGPVYAVQITTPDEARRISIDTSRRTILLMDGEGRANLVVEEWSAPLPTEPLDPSSSAVERPAFDAEGCSLADRYTGRVMLAREELSPLTLTVAGDGTTRLELFDARAETIEGFEFACASGAVLMEGEGARYEGTLGPLGRSVVGSVSFDGEPGLFWLVATDGSRTAGAARGSGSRPSPTNPSSSDP